MEKLTITIETISPVILTGSGSSIVLTESRPYISGTTIRGILASRYVATQEVEQKGHEDAVFRDLFFNQLRYVHAYSSELGQRAFPLPLSLLKAKSKAQAEEAKKPYILDTIRGEFAPGYKGLKGMGYVDANGVIRMASVKGNISFHMSRSSDAERLGGHSKDGQVYNYESLDRGQAFMGEIIGEAAALQALQQALKLDKQGGFETQIGRSKYTQYGHCRITLGDIEPLATPAVPQAVYIRLDTPAIAPFGTCERAVDFLTHEVADALKTVRENGNFSIGKIASATEEVDNFVQIWGMRRPRQFGLSAGTIFELRKDGPWQREDMDALTQLIYAGIGDRTEEGFGQLRLWQYDTLSLNTQEYTSFTPEKKTIHSAEVKRVVIDIVRKRIQEAVRLQAYKDVNSIDYIPANSTHMFSRFESLLGRREELAKKADIIDDFIQHKVSTAMPIATYLHSIKLRGTTLYDLLHKENANPYDAVDVTKIVPGKLLEQVGVTMKDIYQDEAFYDYWLWFFRHGRKRAIEQGKERGDAK